MKYKLAFVKECKKQYLWYKEELKPLLDRHNMPGLYEAKILHIDKYRWWPEDVFAALEK